MAHPRYLSGSTGAGSTPPDAPGNLGAAYTLSTAGTSQKTLFGTLNANHVLTITGLAAGTEVTIGLVQDSVGNRTFSILVNGLTRRIAVNQPPLEPTQFKLLAVSATDYMITPLGA